MVLGIHCRYLIRGTLPFSTMCSLTSLPYTNQLKVTYCLLSSTPILDVEVLLTVSDSCLSYGGLIKDKLIRIRVLNTRPNKCTNPQGLVGEYNNMYDLVNYMISIKNLLEFTMK